MAKTEDKKKRKLSYRELKNRLKNEKLLVRLIITCSILLIGCAALGIFHSRRISATFSENSYEYIFGRAEITSQYFSEDFQRRGSLVASESKVLSELNAIGKENICSCLKSLENSGEFDYAHYVSNRGIKYRSDGSLNSTTISNYSKYIDSTSDIFVYKNFAPEISNDEICFASPVTKNGIVQGYVIGIINASRVFTSLSVTESSKVAERYLADSKGDIVAFIKNDICYDGTGLNIFDILTTDSVDDFAADVAKDEITNELVENEMATRQITINGKSGYALFKQIAGSKGWAIYYIVYEEMVHSMLRPVIVETVLVIFGIIFMMVLMIILIMRYLSVERQKIFDLAYVDELTSAPNENAFKERAATLIHEYPELPYVVCCFDIVNFRYINEGYGHLKADMLLRAVTTALAESYSYNETYARLSADRFVGLCVDDGRLAERKAFILERLKEETEKIPMKYPIRIKTGIYYVRSRKENVSDMIDKANLARKVLNAETSRSLENEYRETLMETTRKQEYIESRMEAALANGEFVPYLQPKWDMEKDHIYGAEALVRWKKPDGGIVPPGDFIPLFEKNGFIEKVDFYMLEQICKYLREMIDQGRAVYPISINQSRYLMYDPNYISKVQQILLKYKVPKGLIELELTETVFFHEKDRMLDVMRQLKEFNMNLSIDDFGSGYSSLNLLRDIPFDVLKIDRGFLDESTQSETGRWILRKIVEMAEGLNLRVICEGVENYDQVDMLLSIGCKVAQGFLYSRPIPMEEYIEKYDLPVDDIENYIYRQIDDYGGMVLEETAEEGNDLSPASQSKEDSEQSADSVSEDSEDGR